jgi:hypothetical protein
MVSRLHRQCLDSPEMTVVTSGRVKKVCARVVGKARSNGIRIALLADELYAQPVITRRPYCVTYRSGKP